MARLAGTDFDADWVGNSDAAEFWCSRRGPLKTLLAGIPPRFSTVRGLLRNFAPPTSGASGGGDLTLRIVPGELPAASPFRAHPFHAQEKVVHRAHPDVKLSAGNHEAFWEGSTDLRGWWPLEVLHFPLRSAAQSERKWENWERYHYVGYEALNEQDPHAFFAARALDEAAAASGIAEGWLIEDTRLRHALAASASSLPASTWHDDALYALDISAGAERDSVVRSGRRLEEIDVRPSTLEHQPWRLLRRG